MSGSRARLTLREELCIGCYACEVACKQEHGLPEGPRLIRVRPVEPALDRDASAGSASAPCPHRAPAWYAIDVCRHCDDPGCVAACPTGAVSADADRVTVDADLCSGCQDCAAACPYGVTWFDPATGALALCDLCWSRVGSRAKPACVHHCPADALALATPAQPDHAGGV